MSEADVVPLFLLDIFVQGLGKIFIPLRSLLIGVLLQKSRAVIAGSARYHLKVRADRI